MTPTLQIGSLFVILGTAAAAPAGPLWGYRSPTNDFVLSPGAAAGLTFPNSEWADGPADGRITATTVESWSIAPTTSPDLVTRADYTFDLEIKDYASGMSGVLNFQGVMDGSIWKTGSTLSNEVAGAPTRELPLGDKVYAVTLSSFDGPTGFGDEGAGRITADVTILSAVAEPVEGQPDAPTAQTPEPATAVLAGLAALGGLAWRRRRS